MAPRRVERSPVRGTSGALHPSIPHAGLVIENVPLRRGGPVTSTVVGRGRFEIREQLADHHHMLVARVRFLPAEVVLPFGVREPLAHPTRHSVQTGASEHILLAPHFLQYINHSCDPNVVFDTEAHRIKAVRAIEPGEEIVFFYPSTEWRMASPFECLCGSVRCVGRIAGASALDARILAKYQLAPHIERLLSTSAHPVSPAP